MLSLSRDPPSHSHGEQLVHPECGQQDALQARVRAGHGPRQQAGGAELGQGRHDLLPQHEAIQRAEDHRRGLHQKQRGSRGQVNLHMYSNGHNFCKIRFLKAIDHEYLCKRCLYEVFCVK
jgi:hypothetical protein